jgi:hypothetical protein
MKPENSLNHSKCECKYHIVWIPKYRKKSIYKDLQKYLGATLKDLALQKECTIEEGHLMSDHENGCLKFNRFDGNIRTKKVDKRTHDLELNYQVNSAQALSKMKHRPAGGLTKFDNYGNHRDSPYL